MGVQPQPLTSVYRGDIDTLHYYFNLTLPTKSPNLGLIVLSTINEYSTTDYFWSRILIELLHADPETGSSMYQSLVSADARRAALLAAAKARLKKKDDYMLFEAVVRAVASQRRRRNEFAHCLWGYSQNVKDALLLAEPDAFVAAHVREKTFAIRNKRSKRTDIDSLRSFDISKIVVYSRDALKEVHRQAAIARHTVGALGGALYDTHGRSIEDGARRRLLRRPQVGPAFRKLSLQNTPATPKTALRKFRKRSS